MKGRWMGMAVALVSVAALGAIVASRLAASTTTYEGCMECVQRQEPAEDYCRQVGHEETGNVLCDEVSFGGFGSGSVWCRAYSSPCFNVTVGGGGGGGTGGGGTCTIVPGGFCPMECPSCTQDPRLF